MSSGNRNHRNKYLPQEGASGKVRPLQPGAWHAVGARDMASTLFLFPCWLCSQLGSSLLAVLLQGLPVLFPLPALSTPTGQGHPSSKGAPSVSSSPRR